jgi:hypothetical protein
MHQYIGKFKTKQKIWKQFKTHAQKLQWHELPFQEFIKLLNWLENVSFL